MDSWTSTCNSLSPGGPREAQPCQYCFTQWSKNGFFAPQGRHVARAKFHDYRGKNVGTHPQNCQNFELWAWICPSGVTRLHNFYEILSFCTRLYISFWIKSHSVPQSRTAWHFTLSLTGRRPHWVTLKLVPFESLDAVSYSPSIVTVAVSVAVCEIFSVKEWRDLESQVRGCSRSLKMAPFHRPYATFC